MRRFSQRSHMVTVAEINITPLLDLAFVLLIIFVITTPLLEQSISLKLPKGGQPDAHIEKRNIRTIEISNTGVYALDRQRMNLDEILGRLNSEFKSNPELIVYIREDKDSRFDYFAQLLNGCQRYGITRYSVRTAPDQ